MENENQMPQPESSTPTTPTTPMPMMDQSGERKSVGALIGSIIIVLILIVGGFYLWYAKTAPMNDPMMNNDALMMQEQALNQPDPVLSDISGTSASDDISSIDADLSATDLNNLDSGLQ